MKTRPTHQTTARRAATLALGAALTADWVQTEGALDGQVVHWQEHVDDATYQGTDPKDDTSDE